MARIIKDGLHYPIEAFRSFHPEVHGRPSVAVLKRYGWALLLSDLEPEMTEDQVAERGPVEWRDGVAFWTWVVRDKTPEELQAAYEASASAIRQLRNQRLEDSDWVVIYHTERGTNIPLEWEQYRQSLRNITDHVNFPRLTEEDWPVKPE